MSRKIFEVTKIPKPNADSSCTSTRKPKLFLTKPQTTKKPPKPLPQISSSTDISLTEHSPNNNNKKHSSKYTNNNTSISTTSTSAFLLNNLLSKDEAFPEYIISYTQEQLDTKYNLSETLETYNYAIQFKRKDYCSYLQSMNPRNRWILFDWIMEISNLQHFNRETYHLCVMLFDIYLSKIKSLSVSEIQLIGVTCMFIASKFEEYRNPPVEFFAQSTKFTYISRDILECEKTILKTLNWKIHALTLNFWSNYLIYKWDTFISLQQQQQQRNNSIITFKAKPIMYIQFFGVIDVISMDYYNIFKDQKIICGCVLYLLIGLYMKVFTLCDVSSKFSNNDNNNNYNEIDSDSFVNYNMFMTSFLTKEYGVELNSINEYIYYVSEFFVQELFDNAKERIMSLQGRSVLTQDYSIVKMKILEKIRK